MARPRNGIPNLKHHSSSGQFYYWNGNKRVYLGKDKTAAERKLRATIAAGLNARPVEIVALAGDLTVAEALGLYLEHAKKRYSDPRNISRICAAIDAACDRHAATPVRDFRSRALREVREQLIARGHRHDGRLLSRRYINHLLASIVIAFRWLSTEEIVKTEQLDLLRIQASDLVEQDGGRETPAIAAVDGHTVTRTLTAGSPTLKAMIKVQRLAGMRPGEVVRMRREEISTKPGEMIREPVTGRMVQAVELKDKRFWLYAPSKHKNLKRKKPRIIVLNPEAQKILAPFILKTGGEGPLFLQESGKVYTVCAYGHKIMRAVHVVNLRAVREGRALLAGELIERWSPNQLRKAAAEEADSLFDADTAGAFLGHGAGRRALDSYIQQSVQKAVQAAAAMG